VPLLQAIAPGWSLPDTAPAVPKFTQWVSDGPIVVEGGATPPSEAAPSLPLTLNSLVAIVWLTGAGISLVLLIAGLVRLSWLARHAERLADGPLARDVEELSLTLALRRRVVLLQSQQPDLPITWGLLRPKIMVPAAAAAWSDDRRHVVLLHELGHIQRRDWVTLLASESVRAIYWFNPLIWLASRQLRQESERACDDVVLGRGVNGRTYAEHLLALARSAAGRRAFLQGAAPAMLRRSNLERRVRAMLNNELNRRPLTRVAQYATAAGALAIATTIAGYGTHEPTVLAQAAALDVDGAPDSPEQRIESPVPSGSTVTFDGRKGTVQIDGPLEISRSLAGLVRISAPGVEVTTAQTFSSLSGVISDATGGLLPGVRVTLVNEGSQALHEVSSNGEGRFEFVGLPPGDYTWRAALPGFRVVQQRIAIAGQNISQDVILELGTLSEAVTIKAGASDTPVGFGDVSRPPDPRRSELSLVGSCGGDRRPWLGDRPWIGGVVRAPSKIRHITPRYPSELAAAGIGGVVILEAVIDTNGFVSAVSVLKSAHPALDQAAVDAVRQWDFTPARLNCTAVDIYYNVTASFVPGQ
jgi:TonB family protein